MPRHADVYLAQSQSYRNASCEVFGSNARSLLAKIIFQDRRVDFRETLQISNRDMLVHHMRGRADEAEFEDRAIGANKPRVGGSAGGRKRRAASRFPFDRASDELCEEVGL